MEPLPESVEVVDEFGPFATHDVIAALRGSAGQVRELVPACVGLSLSNYADDVTLTMVATRSEIAALDAVQYLTDGPLLRAVREEVTRGYDHVDILSEPGWALFARATAAAGVASTLSLPILIENRVTGSINLYAATSGAFDPHHEALGAIFGAWAPGAVTNADLSFSTRDTARDAPRHHRAEFHLLRAAGMLASTTGTSIPAARARIVGSASRSGVPIAMLAEFIIESLGTGGDG